MGPVFVVIGRGPCSTCLIGWGERMLESGILTERLTDSSNEP